ARRMRWILSAVLPAALVYAAFALNGADPLMPLRAEGERFSSGNLPYLLGPWANALGAAAPHLFDGIAVALLATAVIWIYVKVWKQPPTTRARLLMPALALVGMTFMVFSKKSFTGYALFFLYPAIAVLVQGARDLRWCVAFLLVFNVLLAA